MGIRCYFRPVKPSSGDGPDLRTRTREAMRDEVAEIAISLFAEHGFDAVTVAEIARAAGISPRSFFRYFPTKEDVVLLGVIESGNRVAIRVRGRPLDEGAWDALKEGLRAITEDSVYPPAVTRAIARITLETPSIRALEAEKHRQWEAVLLPEMLQRLTRSSDTAIDLEDRGRVLIRVALACLRTATEKWLSTDGTTDPLCILDELIEAVRCS